MNDGVKILRLKTGEDIVATILQNESNFEVFDPMYVDLQMKGKVPGLIMMQWLPVQIIATNHATINSEDVLTVLEPTESFCEYYVNLVNKLGRLLAEREPATVVDQNEYVDNLEDSSEDLDERRILH